MDAHQNQVPQDTKKLKEIPKWTRKYAQNRTLTILVLLAMISLISMCVAFLVGFALSLAVAGFRKGNIILGCVGISILVAAIAAISILMIIVISRFGGKNRGLIDRLIDQRIYGKEGTASMPKAKLTKKKKWLEIALMMVFISLFTGTMYLSENFIPVKYVQPITALYIVPYLVCGWYFFQSPKMGPIYLLGPVLYAVHAVLIIAGVPIFFRLATTWNFILNVCLPFTVYGFLPFIIGHFYGRYALKKLKTAAHLQENSNEQ